MKGLEIILPTIILVAVMFSPRLFLFLLKKVDKETKTSTLSHWVCRNIKLPRYIFKMLYVVYGKHINSTTTWFVRITTYGMIVAMVLYTFISSSTKSFVTNEVAYQYITGHPIALATTILLLITALVIVIGIIVESIQTQSLVRIPLLFLTLAATIVNGILIVTMVYVGLVYAAFYLILYVFAMGNMNRRGMNWFYLQAAYEKGRKDALQK